MLKGAWGLVKESISSWTADYAPSMGAALAYYTLFSIAPLLIIVIAVAGFFLGAEAARGEILDQIRGLIGDEGAIAIQGLLKSASEPKQGLIAGAVGMLTLIVGATGAFAELQSDLDRIWRSPVEKTRSGIWTMLRKRMLSFGMVLAIAFLLLVSLVVSAGLSAFEAWSTALAPGLGVLLTATNLCVSFAIVTGLFALMYKMLPSTNIQWRDVWVGAAVTALLFTIGKFLIGLYLGKAGVGSAFGAAGSLVVLIVWVYYSAQIFLLGAEFTWVYAHRHGSRTAQSIAAETPESSAQAL